MTLKYRVTIFYREPTYELHREKAPQVYKGCFEVYASDDGAALDKAMLLFEDKKRKSSVRWVRQVVGYECEPVVSS